MRLIMLVMLSISLMGCAEWQAGKAGVATHGAMIADEEMITAEWATCKLPTMGAVERRYPNYEAIQDYFKFCGYEKLLAPPLKGAGNAVPD